MSFRRAPDTRVTSVGATLVLSVVALSAAAQDWSQWAGNPRHDGASAVIADQPIRIEGAITIDPFAETAARLYGYLPVHYPAVLLDGDDVFVIAKEGTYSSR